MSEVARDLGSPASAVRASESMLLGNLGLAGQAILPEIETTSTSGTPIVPEQGALTEKTRLASVLRLPLPEAGQTNDSNESSDIIQPATTLDVEYVRDVLMSDKFGDTYERVRVLLACAWNSTSHIERILPAGIRHCATDNPADWYKKHQVEIDRKIASRTGLHELYIKAQPYESSPFLRNIDEICDIAAGHSLYDESARLAVSSRQIVAEASEAWEAQAKIY